MNKIQGRREGRGQGGQNTWGPDWFGGPEILIKHLFTLYINDLPNCLKHTTPRMFADDTSLTAAGETLSEVEKRANEDLRNVHNWLSANKLNLNIAKTEYVLIGSRHRINSLNIQPSINIDKQSVKRVKHSKVLGVQIDEHLAWTKHIEFIVGKISSGML